MPLHPNERENLDAYLDKITLGGATSPAVPSGILASAERLLTVVERIATMLAPRLEQALAAEEADLDIAAPATDAPRRRGRQPKAAGGAAAAATTGATAQSTPPVSHAQSVAQVAQVQTQQPAQGGDLGASPDPLDEMPKGNGASTGHPLGDDAPGYLQRAQPAPPPAKEITAAEVKDVLKQYIDRKGATGTVDLTNLLVKVGGVRKFSELPPAKYGEIVALAKAEAGLQ